MVRLSNPQKSGKSSKKFNPKSNVLGYAKRKSTASTSDVYEYAAPKVKGERSKRNEAALLDHDELASFGANDDDSREALRARLVGEEGLASDDEDEEIDSDEAFESSDEEEYAGFFSRKNPTKKKQKQVKFMEVDLNEDEEPQREEESQSDGETDEDEEESGSASEFIDVLDMLDGRGEAWDSDDDKKSSQEQSPNGAEGSEEEEDEVMGSSDEEDDNSRGGSDALTSLITSLPTTSNLKRASPSTSQVPDAQPRKKRRILKERTEVGEENPFRAVASSQKLSLTDLLSSTTGLSADVAILDNSSKAKPKGKGKAHTDTLPVPLDTRTTERLGREAAYDDTKQEVSQNWDGTMKRLRDAEFLQFPLQRTQAPGRSGLELAAKFQPSNELETGIAALLCKAQLASEGDMLNSEEQALEKQLVKNEVSREEVMKRRANLRQMRELTLRAEMKARRANKIKSKVYRKLKRKEKAKLNADGEDEEDVNDPKVVLERIKLRAGVKVKAKKRSAARLDEESGSEDDDINKELDREERLSTLIRGDNSSAGSEEDSDDEDEENWDLSKARKELSSLHSKESLSNLEGEENSGVFGMKFMQDAMKRREREAKEGAEQLLKELDEEFGGGSDPQDADNVNKTVVQRSGGGGRVTLQPGQTTTQQSAGIDTSSKRHVENESEDEEMVYTSKSKPFALPPPQSNVTESSNPWLTRASGSQLVQKKKNDILMSKDLASGERGALYRIAKKASTHLDVEPASEMAEVDLRDTLVSAASSSDPPSLTKKASTEEAEEDSEAEHQEKMLQSSSKSRKRELKAFEQKELVALAFAGDGIVQNFDQIKQREINQDAPKEIDTTLPGWGAWGGSGVRKNPNKKPNPKLIKTIPGVRAEERKDAGKKHLIISEKADKKASKYTIPDLPYPYTSRAQYERSLAQPVGKEWNTRVGFGRNTLPKVSVRPGTIIDPLKLEKGRKS